MIKILLKFSFIILLFEGCVPYSLPHGISEFSYDKQKIKKNLSGYHAPGLRDDPTKTRELGMALEGETNFYGIKVSADLEQAYRAHLAGDIDGTLKALDKMKASAKEDEDRWQEVHLRIKTLLMFGQGQDALELTDRCIALEAKVFNSNLNCIALRGEVQIWLEHYDEAESDLLSVLESTGGWELPYNFIAIPANMDSLVSTTTAQIRAIVGLAAIYYFKNDYKESYYWALEGEKRLNNVLRIINNPLYGLFIKPHLDIYYGTGTLLAILAADKVLLFDDVKEGRKLLDEARVYYQKIGLKRGEAIVPTIEAYTFLKAGKGELALRLADNALSFVNKYGFFDLSWRIEVEKAQYLYKIGRHDEAEKDFRNAQKTLRYISNTLGSDHSKIHFGVGKEGITKYLVKIDMEKKDYKQLFADLEEGRSRAFLDLFSGTVIQNQGNPYLSKIKALDEKILKQSIMTGANHTNLKLHAKLKLLREQRQNYLIQLRDNSPRLASAISIWSGKLEDFQKNLKAGENALYYFIVDNKLAYLEITKNTIRLHKLDVDAKAMKTDLDILYDTVATFDVSNKTRGLKRLKNQHIIPTGVTFNSQKKKVYQALGLKQNVKKKTYVIPSGVINFVPWGVLDIKNPIALLTSASLLNYPPELMQTQSDAVIIGNPNFGGELPQLAGAEEEAKHIAKVYKTKALIRSEATRAKLHTSVGKGTNILHLATHGTFDSKDPLDSAIYLSKDGKSDKVTAREIYQNPFKAHLVVLSACETGLGKSISGDDLLGLTRTFFLGGSSAVLNTLWEVDDQGTKEFMKVFHTHAKKGNYAKGYMKARQHLKDRGYPPSIYGAFILNGKDLH